MTHPLLDLAPLTAAHFASIEGRVAALLATGQDVVIMQGEALLPLEGCIRGGAPARLDRAEHGHRPVRADLRRLAAGLRRDGGRPGGALPHGGHGRAGRARRSPSTRRSTSCRWCTRRRRPATPTRSRRSARWSGRTARCSCLDAVASVGAEPLLPDAWGVDLCVIGAQKAMGGPGRGVGGVGERAGVGADGGEPGGAAPLVPLAAGLEGALDRRRPHGAAARSGAAGDAGAGGLPGADRGGGPGRGDGPARGGRGGDPGGCGGAGRRAGAVRARGGDAAPVATTLRAPAGSTPRSWWRGRWPRIRRCRWPRAAARWPRR